MQSDGAVFTQAPTYTRESPCDSLSAATADRPAFRQAVRMFGIADAMGYPNTATTTVTSDRSLARQPAMILLVAETTGAQLSGHSLLSAGTPGLRGGQQISM